MATLIEDLQTLLNPLATGGASYAINEAAPVVLPYIVFQRIVSDPNVALGGASALQNTRVQIDVYAARQLEAMAVDALVVAALAAWGTQNVPLPWQDFYDEASQTYRVSRDYSVWSTN